MSDGGERKRILKRKIDGNDLLGPLKLSRHHQHSGQILGEHLENTSSNDEPKGEGRRKRRFKEKHSLDSDEEDDDEKKVEEILDEEEIEGQEDATIDYDEGIKITPFNMKEELQTGHFDKQGTYIFDKEDEIRDNWIDNIDWQQIKQIRKKNKSNVSFEDEDSVDSKQIYQQMFDLMQPGETVLKALRRLGGSKGKKPMSSIDRWKNKKQAHKTDPGCDSPVNEEGKQSEDKDKMLRLTGYADKLLNTGQMEVYEMTYEKLRHILKLEANKNDSSKKSLKGEENDDNMLDIFADSIDDKVESSGKTKNSKEEESSEDKNSQNGNSSEINLNNDEVSWFYKWTQEDDDVYGPYSSSQMMHWTEEGYFPNGVLVRKANTDGQFYSSKRIDFDLYI